MLKRSLVQLLLCTDLLCTCLHHPQRAFGILYHYAKCMDRKHGLSQRLTLGNWMPLTHGLSKKILWILYTRHVTNASVREVTTYQLPSSFRYHLNKKAPLLWPCNTFRFQARSSPKCQCIAATTKRLEETSRYPRTTWLRGLVPMYSWQRNLEKGQWLCSLATYHRYGNTPLGARHWRENAHNQCEYTHTNTF